jgi:hypothetical protein
VYYFLQSRDISVGIALGFGLDDRGSRVRFPAGAGNFSLYHRVQNGSGAPKASYPMGTSDSFLGGKAAGVWSWPLPPSSAGGQRMSGAILPLPQYARMAWCSVKAQGQLYLLYFKQDMWSLKDTKHTDKCSNSKIEKNKEKLWRNQRQILIQNTVKITQKNMKYTHVIQGPYNKQWKKLSHILWVIFKR